MMRQRRKSWCGCCVSNTRGHDRPVMSALPPARKRARLWALTGIGAPTRENDAVRNRFRHLGRRRGARRPLMRAGHTGFQRLKGSVKGAPSSDEQTVAEKMRSLLRFGAGSMRHREVFDVYHRLRIKGIDVGVWVPARPRTSSETSRCAKRVGLMRTLVLRGSSRTGVAFADFPGRKTIGWSFPWGR